MDAGTADTINRRDADKIAKHLDLVDWFASLPDPATQAWYRSTMADTLLGTGPATNSDRAWLVGILASKVSGIAFDGAPADCDWENFYNHLRAEILARRDPQAPPARTAEPCPGSVV
jgi:hypothetical protein